MFLFYQSIVQTSVFLQLAQYYALNSPTFKSMIQAVQEVKSMNF